MSPQKFTVQDWEREAQNYIAAGYRRDGGGLFLFDANDVPVVLDFGFPWSSEWKPAGPLLPHALPLRLEKARLVPPPCCRRREDAEVVIAFAQEQLTTPTPQSTPLLWKFQAFAAQRGLKECPVVPPWGFLHHEALAPTDADRPRLARRLRRMQERWKSEHAEDCARLEAAVEALASNQSTDRTAEMKRRLQAHDLSAKRARLHARFTAKPGELPDHPHGGVFHWTVESILEGAGGVLDAYLKSRWARRHGFDLAEMKEERYRFARFILRNLEHADGESWENAHPDPYREEETNSLAGRVRYALVFENHPKVYLARYGLRPPNSAAEAHEIQMLEQALPGLHRLTPIEAERELGISTTDRKHRVLKGYCEDAGVDFRDLRRSDSPALRAASEARRGSRVRAVVKANKNPDRTGGRHR